MSAATVEFFGGLGVIGSSKVMVRDGEHRVLLDIGLDFPTSAALFRSPVRERPGRELSDRLRVGAAPRLDGVFDPDQLGPAGRDLAAPVCDTAVFLSHPHIDHVGLAGFVRPDIPMYAHADAVAVLAALEASGAGLAGGDPLWQQLTGGSVVTCGAIEVECVPVDHDVPGACGYLVRTSDGTLAFTGDLRFHGRHRERSEQFVQAVAGCDVLVTEGTSLGWLAAAGRPRDDDDVAASYADALATRHALVLLTTSAWNVDRIRELLAVTARSGRRLVWPRQTAAYLRRLGLEPVDSWDTVDAADIDAAPGCFVVCPDPGDYPSLLDLPLGPESVYLHANGEPLGDFDPRWSLFADWTAALGVPVEVIGCSGHATGDDLHAMVERTGPKVVFPIHTTAPTGLHPPIGVRRVVAEYGARYGFDGARI